MVHGAWHDREREMMVRTRGGGGA
uniref:Uncharacterized protein n=1 Tax=Arundo donax TaxID=35708 RepID=A0A0A8Z573_ARUDO